MTGADADTSFPTETDLTAKFGPSRSITREAEKMLIAKGLLAARPRRGTPLQPASSRNLYDSDVLR